MLNRITQSALISLNSLWANKVRSFITMLGIIIGVGSVVLIMSIGAGAQSLILSQIEKIGGNLVGVIPGHSDESAFSAFLNFSITTLKYEDMVYLRSNRNNPHIVSIIAYSRSFGAVKWRSETYDTSINGTTASYLDVERGEIETGRFFTEEEERNLSRVAVLGHSVKEGLFGDSDAVGQRIKIGDSSFEVIGVIKERGSFGPEDADDQVVIPIKTAQRRVGVNHIGLMRARIDDEKNVDAAIADIKASLRERHDIRDNSGKSDDFTVASSQQIAGILTAITDGVRYFLTAMAAISLVVGGIGIMNIMLISVTERTREIGLRKAIGAKNSDILGQFLLEAIFVTGIGGAIGIAIGSTLAFLVSLGVQFFGFNWEFIIPPMSIVLALIVSAGVGLIFGLYPAYKASKLDPIVALHYE